MFDMSENKHKA